MSFNECVFCVKEEINSHAADTKNTQVIVVGGRGTTKLLTCVIKFSNLIQAGLALYWCTKCLNTIAITPRANPANSTLQRKSHLLRFCPFLQIIQAVNKVIP